MKKEIKKKEATERGENLLKEKCETELKEGMRGEVSLNVARRVQILHELFKRNLIKSVDALLACKVHLKGSQINSLVACIKRKLEESNCA